MWKLKKLYTLNELKKFKPIMCSNEDCGLVACSRWESTEVGEPRNLCLDCQAADYNGWPSSNEQVLPVDHITMEHRRLIVEMCSDPEENPNPAMPDLPLVLTEQMLRDAVTECTLELPPLRSTGKYGYAGVVKKKEKYKGRVEMNMMGKKQYLSNGYDTPLEAAKWHAIAVHLRDTRWCVKETKSVQEIDTLNATPIPSNPLALRFVTTLSQVRSEGYVRVEEGGNHDLTVEQLRDSDIVMGYSSSKDHIGTKNFREKLKSMQMEYTSGGGQGRLCSKVVGNYVNDLINGPKKVRFMERYLDSNNNLLYGAVGTMRDVSIFWSNLLSDICEVLNIKKKKATKKTETKKTGMDEDDDLFDDDNDEDFKPKSKKRKK